MNGHLRALEAAKIAYRALEDKKGIEIKVLDIHEVSILADYFIICSGNNNSQLQAIADETCHKLYEAGFSMKSKEGYQNTGWIVLDFGFIIVHIFGKEERPFYNLDKVWADAKVVEFETLV